MLGFAFLVPAKRQHRAAERPLAAFAELLTDLGKLLGVFTCLVGVVPMNRHHDEVFERHELLQSIALFFRQRPRLLERCLGFIQRTRMQTEQPDAIEHRPFSLPRTVR